MPGGLNPACPVSPHHLIRKKGESKGIYENGTSKPPHSCNQCNASFRARPCILSNPSFQPASVPSPLHLFCTQILFSALDSQQSKTSSKQNRISFSFQPQSVVYPNHVATSLLINQLLNWQKRGFVRGSQNSKFYMIHLPQMPRRPWWSIVFPGTLQLPQPGEGSSADSNSFSISVVWEDNLIWDLWWSIICVACLHEDEMEYLDEEGFVFFLSIDCPQCYAENSPSFEIK